MLLFTKRSTLNTFSSVWVVRIPWINLLLCGHLPARKSQELKTMVLLYIYFRFLEMPVTSKVVFTMYLTIYICAPGSNDRGHFIFVLSVCLSVVNFNLRCNIWTVRDRDFMFGMNIPLMTAFQMTPMSITLWPWLWHWI